MALHYWDGRWITRRELVRVAATHVARWLVVGGLVAAGLWLSGKVALVHTDVGMAGTTSLMRVERWHLEWRFDYHIIQGSTDFKRDTDGQPL